jgi:pimeloyl-ACP methyl ester carboxylesterase
MRLKAIVLVICVFITCNVSAQPDTLGWRLEHFKYPYAVKYMKTIVEEKPVEIAYMDEQPAAWNGKTVLLMHGKNFPAAYWGNTMSALNKVGYRVIAPDALGFGKSSKPVVRYSFSLLALITRQLLDTLHIEQAAIVGHSTGGMLATRFALEYPARVTRLVLADAIGLEDWRAEGAPYRKVDTWYKEEKEATYEQVVDYHKQYYAHWNEKYRVWADVQYGMMKGRHADQYAMVSALMYDMIFTEPVLYEFGDISVPTLVIVGKEDKTKIARETPPEIAARLGNYHLLGKRTRKAIPHARLIEYDNAGHLPFFEREEDFYKDVISFLGRK